MESKQYFSISHILIFLGIVFGTVLAVLIFVAGFVKYDEFYKLEKEKYVFYVYNNLEEDVVQTIYTSLRENREALLNYFRVEHINKMTIRVWGDEEEYLIQQEKAIGNRYPGSKGYVTLKDGDNPGELRLLGSTGDISRVTLHEFVHLVTLEVNPSFANNPRWLWEAIAIYKSENQWKYAENTGLTRDRFDQMAQSLMNGDTGVIYEIGFTIGEFIEESWGREGLVELIHTNGDFSKLTKAPIEKIFLSWKDFVYRRYSFGAYN